MNEKKKIFASLMAFTMADSSSAFDMDFKIPKGRTKKDYAPWASEHLTKAQRKGKSYEEIQELRKKQWLAKGNSLPQPPEDDNESKP